MNNSNHQFHLVTNSPWPLTQSLAVMFLLISIIKFFYSKSLSLMFLNLLINLIISFQWWRDVMRESSFQGFHTKKVYSGLKMGMLMFIISEILFFFSFFWTYFHMSLSPSIEIGSIWPPLGISMFNPYSIPLLNTIILISSGLTITWSHYSMLSFNFNNSFLNLNLTIMLGIYFSTLQAIEYFEAPFSINNSNYGSIFFLITGFHGIHVLIGTTFLLMCSIIMYNNLYTPNHHFSFEAASWYWHFVDVVWLFLYLNIYWWNFYYL